VPSSHAIKTRLQTLKKTVQSFKKASDEIQKTSIHHKTPRAFGLLWNRHLSSALWLRASWDITDSSLQFLHKEFNMHSYKTWVVQKLQNTVLSAHALFDLKPAYSGLILGSSFSLSLLYIRVVNIFPLVFSRVSPLQLWHSDHPSLGVL
jgi:hypothetical protein